MRERLKNLKSMAKGGGLRGIQSNMKIKTLRIPEIRIITGRIPMNP